MALNITLKDIQLRRNISSFYTTDNPILLLGEPAFETDTNRLKIGDGISNYNSLSYIGEVDNSLSAEQVQDIVSSLISGGVGINTTYNDSNNSLSISLSGEEFTTSLKSKLDGVEENAQLNPTDSDIVSSIDNELGNTNWKAPISTEDIQDIVGIMLTTGTLTNISTSYNDTTGTIDFTVSGGGGGLDQEQTEDIVENLIKVGPGLATNYNDATGELTFTLTNEVFTTFEKNKLSGIENNATGDQTNAEIKIAYESNSDTNAFTDVKSTKLDSIEASATLNDTDANLRARSSHTGTQTASTISDFEINVTNNPAVLLNTSKNSYPNADSIKLSNIEDGATGDQTDLEIKGLLEGLSGTARLDATAIKNLPTGVNSLQELSDVSDSTQSDRFALLSNGVSFESRAINTQDISDITSSSNELNYLNGATSNIQNQLNSKLSVSGSTSITTNFNLLTQTGMGFLINNSGSTFVALQAIDGTQLKVDNNEISVVNLSIADINSTGANSIITKEYADSNYSNNNLNIGYTIINKSSDFIFDNSAIISNNKRSLTYTSGTDSVIGTLPDIGNVGDLITIDKFDSTSTFRIIPDTGVLFKYDDGTDSFTGDNSILINTTTTAIKEEPNTFIFRGDYTTENLVQGTDASYVLVASTLSSMEQNVDGTTEAEPIAIHMCYDGEQKIVGLRFDDIDIPQGATIQSAYIQFTAEGTSTGAVSINIFGEDSDNSVFFSSSGTNNLSNRTKTTASVVWNPADWNTDNAATANERTSDISTIIQEIVDRPGYVGGTDVTMSFILESTDSNSRNATSWDNGNGVDAPVLHVNYTI